MLKFLRRHDKSQDDKPKDRLPRFNLEIQLTFRQAGEFAWLNGKTKNISRSGALFGTGKVFSEKTPLEFRFVAPAQFCPESGQLISCRGIIVRVVMPTAPEIRPLLAAKFSELHVARSPGQW